LGLHNTTLPPRWNPTNGRQTRPQRGHLLSRTAPPRLPTALYVSPYSEGGRSQVGALLVSRFLKNHVIGDASNSSSVFARYTRISPDLAVRRASCCSQQEQQGLAASLLVRLIQREISQILHPTVKFPHMTYRETAFRYLTPYNKCFSNQ